MDDITVGDLITSFHNGYHIVVQFEQYGVPETIVHYVTVCNNQGFPLTSTEQRSCALSLCKKVTIESIEMFLYLEMQALQEKHTKIIKRLKEFLP